jgi:hypothetical protein
MRDFVIRHSGVIAVTVFVVSLLLAAQLMIGAL